MAIKGAHNKHPQITPHLVVQNARAAVEFYRRAFGAEVVYESKLPFGDGMHFHVRLGGSVFMVTDEMPGGDDEESKNLPSRLRAPRSVGGTTALLEIYVDDADVSFDRAVREGAHPSLPMHDAFWGDRYGWVTDPFGHIWALATMKDILEPEEIEQRMAAMFGGACQPPCM